MERLRGYEGHARISSLVPLLSRRRPAVRLRGTQPGFQIVAGAYSS